MKAKDLIARQTHASQTPLPSKAALRELKALCDYNDASAWGLRVSAAKAIAMLQSMGWRGKGRGALDRLCVSQLGRHSFGTP